MMEKIYSDFIDKMPEADIPFEGVYSRLLQGEKHQALFFKLPKGTVVPPHSHCAQWGIVVSGQLKLTIEGVTKVYGPGEVYVIDKDGVHEALCLTDVAAIDFFDDPARYKSK